MVNIRYLLYKGRQFVLFTLICSLPQTKENVAEINLEGSVVSDLSFEREVT